MIDIFVIFGLPLMVCIMMVLFRIAGLLQKVLSVLDDEDEIPNKNDMCPPCGDKTL